MAIESLNQLIKQSKRNKHDLYGTTYVSCYEARNDFAEEITNHLTPMRRWKGDLLTTDYMLNIYADTIMYFLFILWIHALQLVP